MTTRRRRTTTPKPVAPAETTHEEMLEVAAEREEVEQFLEVMVEDAFSNLGEQDFFEPTPAPFVAIPPAPTVEPEVTQKPEVRPLLTRKSNFFLREERKRRSSRRG
jgi:hypothetical protein